MSPLFRRRTRTADRLLELGGGGLHLRLVFGAHLVAQLSELLVGLVTRVSAWFFRSMRSRFSLSTAAFASASFTILSTSLSLRVEAPVMEMLCSLPLPLSLAVTLRMPLASLCRIHGCACAAPGSARYTTPLVLPEMTAPLAVAVMLSGNTSVSLMRISGNGDCAVAQVQSSSAAGANDCSSFISISLVSADTGVLLLCRIHAAVG